MLILDFYDMCHVIVFFIFMLVNKAVVGSGSEGTPKYAGKGVTYRVSLGLLLIIFHMYALPDALRPDAHTLGYIIAMLHHGMMSYGTLMTSSHDVVIMSEV